MMRLDEYARHDGQIDAGERFRRNGDVRRDGGQLDRPRYAEGAAWAAPGVHTVQARWSAV